jgi:hypothetical protein
VKNKWETNIHKGISVKVHFNFLDVAAEQRVRGRVARVEILGVIGEISSYVIAELTHTPL